MNAFEILFTLILLRLALPIGLLLLVGEWSHRRERARFQQM